MPILAPTPLQQRLVFWTVFVVLLLVSAASFVTTQRLVTLSENAERSQDTLLELERFLSHVKDVETGARGYAITGDRRHLLPYQTGTERSLEALSRLRDLAGSELSLQQQLADLERQARQRISLAAALVDSRERGSPDAIMAQVDDGKSAMDGLRRDVRTIKAEERAGYEQLRRTLERQTRIMSFAMILGVVLSLAAFASLFILAHREVVRRRQAEEELRDFNAELEQRVQERTTEVERSRKLLDAVIENLPDTVFLKDVRDEFRYVLVNEAGEKLLGRERSEVVGHVDHELFPRTEAALCRREDREIAETGQRRIIPERSLTTDHGQRLIESRKIPLLLDDGRQQFVLGIVRDVTDQKSLEKQVREMQRMEAVGRLTGGVAHDFNNLLAIIMGSVELVREQIPEDSETAIIADEALDAVGRGAELVRRLLAFARKQHLEPSAIALNDRLPEIIPLLRRTLGETIRLEVKPNEHLWLAMIDPTQFDDALVNLAINARDAMPDGGSLIIETDNVVLDEDYAAHHIEVTPGEYVMLAVSDTGSGMSPETVVRAFEPFFTTKPEGRGTGLGLSQVYGWVKQSGGHIKIYSEDGRGTSVKLYLPRAAARDARQEAEPQESAAPGGHETILVVEDNPNVRRTVLRQLAGLGYLVIEAEDAATALHLIRQGTQFDLLLTDVVMPGGMTGYELADEAAALRPGLKVLFTSGYTELAEQRRERSHKGPLISKPYRKQELGRAIRSVLDNDGDGRTE